MDPFSWAVAGVAICLFASAVLTGVLSWLLTGTRLSLVGGLAAALLVGVASAVAIGWYFGSGSQGTDGTGGLYLWAIGPALGVGASAGGAIGSLTRGSSSGKQIGKWWLAWLPFAILLTVMTTAAALHVFGLAFA